MFRVSGPPEKLSLSGPSQEFVAFHHNSPTGKYDVGHTRDLDALKHGVIHSHVVSRGADGVLAVRIKNHQVGIAAGSDRALAWIQTKELGRGGGNQLHKAIHAEVALGYAARIHEAHAMLNARPAVGYFREIIAPHLLLLLETKRTVVGVNHLQMVPLETIPEFFLVPLLAQWRGEDVLRAFKARYVEILDGEIQILRTGLRIDGEPAIACLAHFLQGVITAEVHNVNRRASHLRQSDRPGRSLGLRRRGPGQSVIFRRFFPFGEGLLDDYINGAAVFSMHADQPAVLCGRLKRFENAAVI